MIGNTGVFYVQELWFLGKLDMFEPRPSIENVQFNFKVSLIKHDSEIHISACMHIGFSYSKF